MSLPKPLAAMILALGTAAGADSVTDAHGAHDAYLAAINANDLTAFLQTVTDDIVFVAPNSLPMRGKAEVGPWVGGYFQAVRTEWDKQTLEFVVKDGWAYELYAYEVTDTPHGSSESVSDAGHGINIYRMGEDGVWRVARDIWASSRALPTE